MVYIILIIFAIIYCYAKLFDNLVGIWIENSVYSHGFLIPFLSGYLVWIERSKLLRIQASPNKIIGLMVLFGGLFAFLLGHVGGILFIEEFSLIVTITGMVILIMGKDFLKILWLPIMYLSLMLTIWGTFIEPLHKPFQNLSAFVGSLLLKIVGIPIYRDSIHISLPNITLEVAKECSGISYLIAVLAIAIPISFLVLKSLWRRFILISCSIIIAIFGNGLRVALIGFFSYYDLSKGIHGPNQIFQAMFVTWFGIIALLIGTWFLSKGQSSLSSGKSGETDSFFKSLKISAGSNVKNYLYLATGILIIFGCLINFYEPLPVSLKKDLKFFPNKIGEWMGYYGKPESYNEVYKELGIDQELARTYKNINGDEIKLYVGYHEYQKQDKELINYKTEDFYKGAFTIEVKLNPETIHVNKLVVREGDVKKVFIFWYDINGRIVPSRLEAKAYTIFDGLFKRKTNGAIIVLSQDLKVEDVNPASGRSELNNIEGFIRRLIPVLYDYLPC